MIDIQGLTLKFDDKKVLDDINIQFHPSTINGIVGLNGAGKTTFFNVLANILKSDTGQFLYDNRNISTNDIGYLETVNFFYPLLTASEYLKIFKQTNANFNLEVLQEFTKLPLDDLIETYSTGMKKKLALLGILKKDNPVYILDEPFNGLDMETNKILELIVIRLKEKGKTIFISSHILDPLLTVCDTIHFLDKGKFTKSFNKNDFSKIENELFGQLKEQAKNTITASV